MQSHAPSDPLFPNLNSLELPLITKSFVSLVPLFFSSSITSIVIEFGLPVSKAAVVPVIETLTTSCPNLQTIKLYQLPKDPMITAAVSEMLLVTNRNILQQFEVSSSLTEEASEVVYKLPNLRGLWVTVDGPGPLPTLVLPNLTTIQLDCDDDHGWLQGFSGATFGKLTSIIFNSESPSISDFLEAFKSVALTTSIPATLSQFEFYTSRPGRPNYRSLLPFTQLEELIIEFPCGDYCPSTIDDYIITDLARAMPKLKILHLGAEPCETPAGITIKGLATLAHYSPRLFQLCVHFQAASLDPRVITMPRKYCALTNLDVGDIPVSEGSVKMVAKTLLRIFPRLNKIGSTNQMWEKVVFAIGVCKAFDD